MTTEPPSSKTTACGACGAIWSNGAFSVDCEQCGGGAMTRDCAWCQGACGEQWRRRVIDSWDEDEAQWIAACSAKCSTCGASWARHQQSTGCAECDGGTILRACPECDGACRELRHRDVRASWQTKRGAWLGSCRLRGCRQ